MYNVATCITHTAENVICLSYSTPSPPLGLCAARGLLSYWQQCVQSLELCLALSRGSINPCQGVSVSPALGCSEFCGVLPNLERDTFILWKLLVNKVQSVVRRDDAPHEVMTHMLLCISESQCVPLSSEVPGGPRFADGSGSRSEGSTMLEGVWTAAVPCVMCWGKNSTPGVGLSASGWSTLFKMVPRGPCF